MPQYRYHHYSIVQNHLQKANYTIDDIIKKMSPEYRLVHRLDLDTSGLLIISKNLEYAQIFGKLFKSNNINKVITNIHKK